MGTMQVLLTTLFLSDFCVINGYILCLVTQSYLTLCDRIAWSLPNFSVPGDSPGKNTGVGCYFLLQGVFLTQKLNWGLPHCRWILYQLNYKRTNFIQKKLSKIFNRKNTGLGKYQLQSYKVYYHGHIFNFV